MNQVPDELEYACRREASPDSRGGSDHADIAQAAEHVLVVLLARVQLIHRRDGRIGGRIRRAAEQLRREARHLHAPQPDWHRGGTEAVQR